MPPKIIAGSKGRESQYYTVEVSTILQTYLKDHHVKQAAMIKSLYVRTSYKITKIITN